jgi:Family of unknown function (DUF5302)
MAVEQPGAEAAPTDDAPPGPEAQSEDTQSEDTQSDFDDMKRKFREALERKRSTHASVEGAQDTGKVHGTHGPAVSRRSFRRKSGG